MFVAEGMEEVDVLLEVLLVADVGVGRPERREKDCEEVVGDAVDERAEPFATAIVVARIAMEPELEPVGRVVVAV